MRLKFCHNYSPITNTNSFNQLVFPLPSSVMTFLQALVLTMVECGLITLCHPFFLKVKLILGLSEKQRTDSKFKKRVTLVDISLEVYCPGCWTDLKVYLRLLNCFSLWWMLMMGEKKTHKYRTWIPPPLYKLKYIGERNLCLNQLTRRYYSR